MNQQNYVLRARGILGIASVVRDCDDDGDGGRETRASVIKCVQQDRRACVRAWLSRISPLFLFLVVLRSEFQ